MYSVAFKRFAATAAKQESRSLSTVAFCRAVTKSPASMVRVNAGSCFKSFSTLHTCGPACNHACTGPNCANFACDCKAKKTGVRTFAVTGMDTSTPAAALKALEEGNKRFVAGDIIAPHRNLERVKELAGGQAPFCAFLSCADSRVPVEMVFDQGFGDVFVCRVAGNIVNAETIGSLEFGCAVLGAKVLMVLGHSSCGAVNATMAGGAVPGVISSLYYGIKPGCDASNGTLDSAIAENVKFQVSQLGYSPVLKDLVNSGKLIICGGVYDLATGKVTKVC